MINKERLIMKVLRFIIAVLAFALIFSFIPACASTEPKVAEKPAFKEPVEETATIEETAEEKIVDEAIPPKSETEGVADEYITEDKDASIEVDKGIFSVEITLPASFFEGQDISDIASEVEDDDIKIILNKDGSVTYKMSKSKHNEFMAEVYNDQLEYIEEIKNSGDYKSVKDITYNKTFSEITLVVEQEAFENSFDGFVTLGLGISSLYYQLFNGTSPEDYKVTIYFKNVETGEIFGDVVYPDALEE